MAIGVLTAEKFDSEVSRFVPAAPKAVAAPEPSISLGHIPEVVDIKRGRGNTSEVPMEIRKVVAQELIAGGTLKDVTKVFGVSTASASAYKNGATSTSSYNEPNTELQEANADFKDKVKGIATEKLLNALSAITADKLEHAKVNVASAVAKDMSSIIRNMEPEGPLVQNNNAVILFKPRTREEDDYEVIDIQKAER